MAPYHAAVLCCAVATVALNCTAGLGWLVLCIVGWVGTAGALHCRVGLGQLQFHTVKHCYEREQAEGLKIGFILAGVNSTPC